MGRDSPRLDRENELEGPVRVGVVIKPSRVAHGKRLPDTLAEPEDARQDLLGGHVMAAFADALENACSIKLVCQMDVHQVHLVAICFGPIDKLHFGGVGKTPSPHRTTHPTRCSAFATGPPLPQLP